ncbi:MAG: D-amino-acid transaminase [Alphaproteobacteria bacterium]|nr:D-amino-acid transaminase [Alphaproteobacteria bacterium]
MSRIAYVDGQYLPQAQAMVSMDDRGYQFADGVYEVVTVQDRRLVDEERHLARLERSLGELKIPAPMHDKPLRLVMREVLRRNRIIDGLLYIQITRGIALRDHKFPERTKPVLVMTARPTRPTLQKYVRDGVAVVIIPDIRWRRRDIKSTSLLPNVLGKQHAVEAGAYDAWMVDDDGTITEGTASNAWIVSEQDCIVTRDVSEKILGGITRQTILDLAQQLGIQVELRPFTADEAKRAAEAFLTSASSFVLPVTRLDGQSVADGRPGEVTRRLRNAYEKFMANSPRF